MNKLYFKKNFLIISRNLASPQQIEQVRLPSVCASFPVRSTVIVPTFSLRANIYIVPPQKKHITRRRIPDARRDAQRCPGWATSCNHRTAIAACGHYCPGRITVPLQSRVPPMGKCLFHHRRCGKGCQSRKSASCRQSNG